MKKDGEERPSILLDSAIHARELTGIQTNFYAILSILNEYLENNKTTHALLHSHTIFFLPVINLDSVTQIHEDFKVHGQFSYLRKNQREMQCPEEKGGVDLNRNFGYKWAHDSEGSSPKKCAEDYRGPAPFSEPETKAIKAFFDTFEGL